MTCLLNPTSKSHLVIQQLWYQAIQQLWYQAIQQIWYQAIEQIWYQAIQQLLCQAIQQLWYQTIQQLWYQAIQQLWYQTIQLYINLFTDLKVVKLLIVRFLDVPRLSGEWLLMGTASSVCMSDNDIPEYSPAYLGQIYAGVVLNSAKSSTVGYASTLSLNSIYASSLSLNSISSRKGSLTGKLVQLHHIETIFVKRFHAHLMTIRSILILL